MQYMLNLKYSLARKAIMILNSNSLLNIYGGTKLEKLFPKTTWFIRYIRVYLLVRKLFID